MCYASDQVTGPGAAILLLSSRLLDPLDGWIARRRDQVSLYGTVLDLVVDLLTHSIVWVMSGLWFGPVFIALEWVAGFGILSAMRRDVAWKSFLSADAPGWIKAYFRNGMRNGWCACGVVGHFIVPAAAISGLDPVLTLPLVPGLLLYEAVTVYLIVASLQSREHSS